MSADWWFEIPDVEERPSWNVTYNLSPMLWDAGWQWPDGWTWSTQYLEGVKAADIGEKAMYVLRNLEADPEKYRAMNPENGWGDYDGLVRVWRDFVEAIRKYPEAKVGVWF